MTAASRIKTALTAGLTVIALALVFSPPSGAALKYARGFTVRDLDRASLVTVRPSWLKNGPAKQYLLVEKDAPVPPGYSKALVIRVPVRRLVCLSTTQLAYLEASGQAGRLVGVADFRHVNTPAVRRLINAGHLQQVGNNLDLRIETIMDLEPDLILATASGSIHDVHPKLEEAGLPVVIMTDHLESHPLGRCEWIKLLALFLGTRDHADRLFRQVEKHYLALAARAGRLHHRPTVLTNAPFHGRWWVPGGKSFMARYMADAGGNYLWAGDQHTGSLAKDVEAVFARGINADVWINTGAWKKVGDALAADPRLGQIKALRRGRMFNNNRRLNRWGGNDFWESGILRPDVVLADLIKIFHPGLLTGHKLYYYRRLETGKLP